jgi:hypothetical protein
MTGAENSIKARSPLPPLEQTLYTQGHQKQEYDTSGKPPETFSTLEKLKHILLWCIGLLIIKLVVQPTWWQTEKFCFLLKL